MTRISFDYIIIGAGSAGCVMANRLSDNSSHRVCLLEAGPEDKSPFIGVPGAFAYFMFSKKYNWAYDAEPVADVRHGKPIFCPRGKTLGGSSAVNAMVYIRGHRSDYDYWASLGNQGWGYKDVLPYFIKSETNQRGGSEYHGDSGPLYVSDCINDYAINDTFIAAAQEAGHPYSEDFNGAQYEGVGYYQFTIKDGERCGAVKAFLEPVRKRDNLTITCDAHVTRLLMEDKRVIGVEYVHASGQLLQIFAEKEVVLSGGAINSPQILMLSGIGDPEELNKIGIETVHRLPGVGKNLQDHVDANVLQLSKRTDGFSLSPTGLGRMLPDTFRYLFGKRGKLASSVTQAGAFLKSDPSVQVPDLQMHFLPLLYDDNGRDLKLMSQHGYSCHVCVLRPKSRGSISLRSADPTAPPRIDFNFLSHPDDCQTLINGIRVVRKIFAAPSFDAYRGDEIHPGAEVTSDEEILSKCKERLGTVYHPVGTCKMGRDEHAVVDDKLQVHGLRGLRVVDASIMPTLISGNTNAAVIAIAQKAADMMLAQPTVPANNQQFTVQSSRSADEYPVQID